PCLQTNRAEADQGIRTARPDTRLVAPPHCRRSSPGTPRAPSRDRDRTDIVPGAQHNGSGLRWRVRSRTRNVRVMGVFDAPAWVLAAWRRSLQDVGATADQSTLESYGERMIERWSAPERAHHNLKRLIAVLARVDEL